MEPQFLCPVSTCDFSSTVDNVRIHAKEKHDIDRLVPCVTCHRLFPATDISRHHYNLHASNKTCVFCQKTFPWYRKLVTHINSCHRGLTGLHEDVRRQEPPPKRPLLERMEQVVEIPSTMRILSRWQFIIVYDAKNMRPLFVYEDLDKEMIQDGKDFRARLDFTEDKELSWDQVSRESITFLDFVNGHLAAARNHRNSAEAFAETFLMSNVVPMKQKFNTGIWKSLENHARNLTKVWQSVRVVTGPMYCNESNPPRKSCGGMKVPVPTHFFKILILERPGEENLMQAFLVPHEAFNESSSIFNFRTTIEEIEKLTRLNVVGKIGKRMTWDLPPDTEFFKCPRMFCLCTFMTKEALEAHKPTHDNQFTCSVCGKVFDSADKRKKHKKGHKLHHCTKKGCNYSTIYRTWINRHIRLHNSTKTWKCDVEGCGKAFKSYTKLAEHNLTHNTRFTTHASLSQHTSTHTRKEP